MKKKNAKKSISMVKLSKLLFVMIAVLYTSYTLSTKTIAYVSSKVDVTDMILGQGEKKSVEKKIKSTEDLLGFIATHVELPKENPSTVFKVTEATLPEMLSKMPYLTGIKKDNYVVIYPTLVVVYDADKDILVKVLGGATN